MIVGNPARRLFAMRGGITADIVILRREYFQKIKEKLLRIALGLGKGSWIKNFIALIIAVKLVKKYPVLERSKIGNKNTLAFLDIVEKFNKYHKNGMRQPLFDHFYHLIFATTAHDKYYGSNTFTNLILLSSQTQTITLPAGSIQTATTMTLDGDATHAHSIVSSTAGTLASLVATNATDDYVTYTDIRRSWATLSVGEVLVYNRRLSAVEGTHLYNKTKFRYT